MTQSRNLAARMGSWSAQHRKLAIFATAVFASDLPPRGLTELSAEGLGAPLRQLLRERAGRRDDQPPVLRGGAGAQGALGRPQGHTGAIDAAPDQYERRVVAFFDRALPAQK
jgi:hypothetical protein